MKITSDNIPQADHLDDVVRVVDAVANGINTFQDIAKSINKGERQGRYYRKAAEVLGFVVNNNNAASLTPLGAALAASIGVKRQKIVLNGVLSARIFQRVITYLDAKKKTGVTRGELATFIELVTQPIGPTMAPRRLATITGWLRSLNLISEHNGRFYFNAALPMLPVIKYSTEDEPLFPRKFDLAAYQDHQKRISQDPQTLTVLVDQAKRERASADHELLVSIMAAKLRAYGATPKQSRLIDLAAEANNQHYIFEMKSTDGGNTHSQIRRGISQLYEYRYLHNLQNAKLVLVVQEPLEKSKQWLAQYLADDRDILFVWDGDRKNFYASTAQRQLLPFL